MACKTGDEACSASSGEELGTTSGNALSCNASTIDKVVNNPKGSAPIISRTGEELLALSDLKTSGIIVFQTFALLDAYAPVNSVEEKGSFKVTNDPDTSLNGYYSWVSDTTYTKDASLVQNVIEESNTSDAVSGKAVSRFAVGKDARNNIPSDRLSLVQPLNIFEVGTETDGGYYNTGGNWINDIEFYSSDKLFCTEGDTLRTNGASPRAFSFFDIDDNPIFNGPASIFAVAPANAAYLYVNSRYTENTPAEWVVTINNAVPFDYEPFSKKYFTEDVQVEQLSNKNVANGYVGLNANIEFNASLNDCFDTTSNIFNVATLIPDGYYDSNGNWINDVNFYSSDFMPVEELTEYTSNAINQKIWTWYDSDGFLISGGLAVPPQTSPAGAAFLTRNFRLSEVPYEPELVMVLAGNVAPSVFIPYGYEPNELLVLPVNQSTDSSGLSDVNHLLIRGQSLSLGYNSNLAITLAQDLGSLCFNGSPRSSTYSSLTPLVEDDNGILGESPAAGLAGQAKRSVLTEFHNQDPELPPNMLVSIHSTSGATISQLDKGNAIYDTAQDAVSAGLNLATADSLSYGVSGMFWIQGEADEGDRTDRTVYKDALIQLKNDHINDIATTLSRPWLKFPFITYQTNHRYSHTTPITALAQLDAAEEDSDIFMATPIYYLAVADHTHLTPHSSRWLGQQMGKVWNVIKETGFWRPLSPDLILKIDSTTIEVDFHVPSPPLVIDDILVTNPGDLGFEVEDDSGSVAISDIKIISSTRVRITLSSPLTTNPVLRYAYTSYGASGPLTGARGNLRDSDPTVSNYNNAIGEPYPMFNWCVSFSKDIA